MACQTFRPQHDESIQSFQRGVAGVFSGEFVFGCGQGGLSTRSGIARLCCNFLDYLWSPLTSLSAGCRCRAVSRLHGFLPRPPTGEESVRGRSQVIHEVCADLPGSFKLLVAAGHSASNLPRLKTFNRVARRRIASITSRACNSTKSALQPTSSP